MINDGSAKAVSYVQNCWETKNGHIPHYPQASMYCMMLLENILLQFLLLILMVGSFPNGFIVFRIKFKFSTSFATDSLGTPSRY